MGTEIDFYKFKLIARDRYVGKKLLSFADCGYDHSKDGRKVRAHYWWIASNEEGKHGIIAGGLKNLESFLGWMFGVTGYAYNPVNMDDYVWSDINDAYVEKGSPFVNLRIIPDDYYIVCSDDDYKHTKIYHDRSIFDTKLIWEAGMARLALSVPDGKHCWDPTTAYGKLCSFFDCEDGVGTCKIFQLDLTTDKKGRYLRPSRCADKLIRR